MTSFEYEWYMIDVQLLTGRCTYEIKAKSKENAIRQINNLVVKSNSESNLAKNWIDQIQPITKVYWETLTLDRKGYQRRF